MTRDIIVDHFRVQGDACTKLGSPFMGVLLAGLADQWPDGGARDRSCQNFDGDISAYGHAIALRAAGGLHALVLTGQDAGLMAVYPPNPADPAKLIPAALAAFETHAAFFEDWMKSPPQTNEVRRCAALIPGANWIARRHPLPFVTSELGASGGLNANWNRYALEAGDARLGPEDPTLTHRPTWQGAVPAQMEIRVDEKAAVDLKPVDVKDPAQALRLKSYLWPDQPERMALTEAAIAAVDTVVETGDAADWLETRLAKVYPGHVHMIYHSIAWQYFPEAVKARVTAAIEAAGAQATDDAPIAWLSMEADGTQGSARIGLRMWPGDIDLELGRADYHGRWIKWEVGT